MLAAWKPKCDLAKLKLRAQLLHTIRQFFLAKQVLEVETPLLCHATGTDPHLDFFRTKYQQGKHQQELFLQTSPEFAMKRLLAAGSGSIFQICKAFRNAESGRFHNPEFTILEWYRLDFALETLIDEVISLLGIIFAPNLSLQASEKISYKDLFYQHTGLNPLVFSKTAYQKYALENQLSEAIDLCAEQHSLWLDFIFSHKIQPRLGANKITVVYAYPACQASLAKINSQNSLIADRFEVFVNGVELGNGFLELQDAIEQGQRFEAEIELRRQQHLPAVQKDELFLAALNAGLPDCSGVAIGLDRILMLLDNSVSIENILAFPINNA